MRRKLREPFVMVREVDLPGGRRDSQRWAPVPQWVLAAVPPRRRRRVELVLAALGVCSDFDTRRGWPGRARLANLCGYSIRTADRALRDARRLEAIVTRRRCRRTAILTLRMTPRWLRVAGARGDPVIARARKVAGRKRTRKKQRYLTAAARGPAEPLLEKSAEADACKAPGLGRSPRNGQRFRSENVPCPHYVKRLRDRLRHGDEGTLAVLERLRRRGLSEADFGIAREALELRRERGSSCELERLENDAGYVVATLQARLRERGVRPVTGWRFARGTHSGTLVRDPAGVDLPPDRFYRYAPRPLHVKRGTHSITVVREAK